MNHSQQILLPFAIIFLMAGHVQSQHFESPIYSFTGYYESIQGTMSYYPGTVHWSYLHGADGESIEGLRLSLPYEEITSDYQISELWGNDKGVIFICGALTVLVIKDPGGSPNTPLITLSKTSELQLPPARRSYFKYFSWDHSFAPTTVALENTPEP